MSSSVSLETPEADLPVYARLIEWAVWATDRKDVPMRQDSLAGDYRISEATAAHLRRIRERCFPCPIEACEKAVASMKSPDELVLQRLTVRYFLEWKSIEAIAACEDMSEFHVTEYLQRALRILAVRLPRFDEQVENGSIRR